MPLLARGVPAKDLPGHWGDDLRLFVQLVSLCLPQLPLPEKIAMLKRSHHDSTQISVGLELRWRGGQSFGVGGGYSAGRSSWIRGPSRPVSNYTRCARPFNPVKTAFVVSEEFGFHGQVKP
ncbi:MAG: hypothetical protein DMG43_09820 [Acidobacteria bacterium]|nr:MAG: hypothetical protein DMG43_09820 [Acidobacteriota bacterium]